MKRHWRRSPSGGWSNHVALGLTVGVIVGFFLGVWSRHILIPCLRTAPREDELQGYPAAGNDYPEDEVIQADLNEPPVAVQNGGFKPEYNFNATGRLLDKNQQPLPLPPGQGFASKKLVLIGVMTAKKYLNTRIISSYQTWAKSIPGHVIYFSSEGSEDIALPGLPVIGLKGVDDSYPPQKKSFLMLKYMHDYYLDQYEWFMRADDDLYIKGNDFGKFLRSINSSHPHFIGQAGLGNKEEFGLLSLDKNENFCMGGPGMVLSRVVLERMAVHISYCLKNLYTTHEDVEIGRCVQKFAGVSCSWAFEVSARINLIYKYFITLVLVCKLAYMYLKDLYCSLLPDLVLRFLLVSCVLCFNFIMTHHSFQPIPFFILPFVKTKFKENIMHCAVARVTVMTRPRSAIISPREG